MKYGYVPVHPGATIDTDERIPNDRRRSVHSGRPTLPAGKIVRMPCRDAQPVTSSQIDAHYGQRIGNGRKSYANHVFLRSQGDF